MTLAIDRRGWGRVFTHLTVILLIFVLPELLFRASRSHGHGGGDGMWTFFNYLKTAIFIGIFYLNYFVLIDRYLTGPKRSVWKYIGVNLLIAIALTAAVYGLQHWLLWDHGPRKGDGMERLLRTSSFFIRDLGMMLLTIGLSAALRFGEQWVSLEERHDKMLASQRVEELNSLKSQLNPHFLFNTLNTIYALIEISPQGAQEAVHQLSTLLRHVLYENPAKVSLHSEVDFVRSYISLMEMRLGEGAVEAKFDTASDPDIAPLLFITLIENAFKHGNTGRKDHKIRISIDSDSKGTVRCRTENHFSAPAAGKGGIGISNLRRRLQLLYSGAASLETRAEGDIFTATLTIHTSNPLLP